jgi:hypothetical protein
MTMLTHTRGPFERARYSSGSRSSAEVDRAAAHLATIKRFLFCAVAILAAGNAVAAIMALKIAIYLPLFIRH